MHGLTIDGIREVSSNERKEERIMKTKVFWCALPLMIFALILNTAFGQTAATSGTPATIIISGNLVSETRGSSSLGAWFNGAWVQSTSRETGTWPNLASPATLLAVGDLDGDKKGDLIGRWSDGVWVKYSSTKTWTKIASPAKAIAAGDFDLDGKDDLVGSWDGQGTLYRSSKTGAWVKMGTPASLLACGDIDGDKKDDLIGNWSDGVWVRYSSTNKWAKLASPAKSIATGDMNGDGREDLVGSWDGQGTCYRNSITGAWMKLGSTATLVATGDINGDGKNDLLGVWSDGVWAKYTNGAWTKITSTIPISIAAGYLRDTF